MVRGRVVTPITQGGRVGMCLARTVVAGGVIKRRVPCCSGGTERGKYIGDRVYSSREGHMSYVVLGLREGLLGMFIPKSHMERITSGGAIHIVVLNTLV